MRTCGSSIILTRFFCFNDLGVFINQPFDRIVPFFGLCFQVKLGAGSIVQHDSTFVYDFVLFFVRTSSNIFNEAKHFNGFHCMLRFYLFFFYCFKLFSIFLPFNPLTFFTFFTLSPFLPFDLFSL